MADCFPIISLSSICPALSATRSVSFRTLQQQYGDGYMARRQDGLNPVNYTWNVSTAPMAVKDCLELEKQLIANGTKPFLWAEPYTTTKETWVLDPVQWDWSYQTEDLATLSFTLRRWYS